MTLRTSAVAVCCSRATLTLARARLHLLEEPHILDRDNRLVGEGGDEVDLLLCERPGLGARQGDHADRFVLLQQRDPEHRPESADPLRVGPCVLRIHKTVRNMNHAGNESGSTDQSLSPAWDRVVPHELLVIRGEAVVRDKAVNVAVA